MVPACTRSTTNKVSAAVSAIRLLGCCTSSDNRWTMCRAVAGSTFQPERIARCSSRQSARMCPGWSNSVRQFGCGCNGPPTPEHRRGECQTITTICRRECCCRQTNINAVRLSSEVPPMRDDPARTISAMCNRTSSRNWSASWWFPCNAATSANRLAWIAAARLLASITPCRCAR